MLRNIRCAICIVISLVSVLCSFPSSAEAVIYPTASGRRQLKASAITVDVSNQAQGYIMVQKKAASTRLITVITHEDKAYRFDLQENDEYETLPLSYGNGNYDLSVYEQITPGDDQYREVFHDEIDVFMPDPLSVFLIPNQCVWFTDESELVRKSDELCAGVTDDYDKLDILYTYVSEQILYDYVKAASIAPPYLPNSDETLETGRGICFDYAALLGGMLRAQGIPTQLVTGKFLPTNISTRHAWNKVYLEGNWMLVDATLKNVTYLSPDYLEEYVF